MSYLREWDQTMPLNPGKRIDTSFLADMTGALCGAERVDNWGHQHRCIRIPGHTGRNLATEWQCRYPVAVWS